MKWFWDSYVSAQTSRKESKLSPFLVAHGGSWTGFSDVKEVCQANNNIRSVSIPGASSFMIPQLQPELYDSLSQFHHLA
jgi:hypothetical protein